MAKLVGFVGIKDSSQLKSVGAEGKRLRYINRPNPQRSRLTMVLPACLSHESPTPTVPVELRKFEEGNKEGVKIGTAKVCPLCWTILKAP